MATIDKVTIRRRVGNKTMPNPQCIICGKPINIDSEDWEVTYRHAIRYCFCKECPKK